MDPVVIKVIDDTVKIGYSGKRLGNTQDRFSADAEANFAKFTGRFPGKKVYEMPAVGKDNIVEVDNLTPEETFEMEADGLITRSPDNLLVLKAADCIPVVLYLPGKDFLALAHVGTSGANLHLPAKLVKASGITAALLRCYIGLHISKESYRFPDKDIDDKKLDSSWEDYVTKEPDGIHINLLGYVIDELKSCGVQRIEVNSVDTGGDKDYFSHRRHKITGELTGRNCFAACLQT
jgi:copper oxidase (laccase) domain-containing protein